MQASLDANTPPTPAPVPNFPKDHILSYSCAINGSIMIKLYDKTCITHHMVREHSFLILVYNFFMYSKCIDDVTRGWSIFKYVVIEVLRIKLPSKHIWHITDFFFFIYKVSYNQHTKRKKLTKLIVFNQLKSCLVVTTLNPQDSINNQIFTDKTFHYDQFPLLNR